MGIYFEKVDTDWNTISIQRAWEPMFSDCRIQIEWLKWEESIEVKYISENTITFLKGILWEDFVLGNSYVDAIQRIISILKEIAPCIVNGYFAWPDSTHYSHPFASKVWWRFLDGFWEDPRLALRATSQPSIFDETIKRTTQIFEGIIIWQLFILHYPSITLAPSLSSMKVGEYVAENFLKEKKSQKVLEMWTGTGIITLAMMMHWSREVDFTATDIDGSVLNVAQLNATIWWYDFSRLSLVKSDLFNWIHPNAKFDIIVSNPPFYDSKAALEVIDNPKYAGKVPLKAIDGGESWLDFYEKILEQWFSYLNDEWKFVFQVSPKISQEVLALGRQILWIKCSKSYCVKDGKQVEGKGVMVIFEC